jgi:hypothetical protein
MHSRALQILQIVHFSFSSPQFAPKAGPSISYGIPRLCNGTLFFPPAQMQPLHNGRQEHIAEGVRFLTFLT